MNKTYIIIQREFLSRVQKKTFVISTILLPLLIFGFYALIIYFSVKGNDDLNVAIADHTGLLKDKLENSESVQFTFVEEKDPAVLQQSLKERKYNGYIVIPAGFAAQKGDSLVYASNSNVGLMTKEKIERRINKAYEKIRLQPLLAPGVSMKAVDSTRTEVALQISKEGGKSGSTGFAYVLGFTSGILIYMVLLIYGTMVMRGVMEEKTNRIAEVMVSSVKPYQLMMGKILGIGAVGIVQFFIWGVLIMALQMLLPLFFPGMIEQAAQQSANMPSMTNAAQQPGMLQELTKNLNNTNIGLIVGLFILYFFGGYLLYSALFAAVGCAVNEDPQDAQQLMFPIMMPIIFSFVIMTQALNNPDGGLAMFGSLFPLTSPIVMMARLPYGVPGWQIFLSLALLALGFLGTAWLAARIYRTGILMYGKKPTWKEMWKWAFAK